MYSELMILTFHLIISKLVSIIALNTYLFLIPIYIIIFFLSVFTSLDLENATFLQFDFIKSKPNLQAVIETLLIIFMETKSGSFIYL